MSSVEARRARGGNNKEFAYKALNNKEYMQSALIFTSRSTLYAKFLVLDIQSGGLYLAAPAGRH